MFKLILLTGTVILFHVVDNNWQQVGIMVLLCLDRTIDTCKDLFVLFDSICFT